MSATNYTTNTPGDTVPTIEGENIEYTSLLEVTLEVRDVAVFDLCMYTNRLPESFEAALAPEPAGVYLYGALQPITLLSPNNPLFSQKQYLNDRTRPDILSFEEFINCRDAVVNVQGKLVCRDPYARRKHMRNHCVFNYGAIHMAVIAVWDVLNHLHRETQPLTNLPLSALNVERYLRPEIDPREFDPCQPKSFEEMIGKVMNFIGRDTCSIYTLRVQGTTLYLEKGHDFRVIEYYRRIFDEFEERMVAECHR